MNEAILYVWCVYEDAMVNTQAVYTIQAQTQVQSQSYKGNV